MVPHNHQCAQHGSSILPSVPQCFSSSNKYCCLVVATLNLCWLKDSCPVWAGRSPVSACAVYWGCCLPELFQDLGCSLELSKNDIYSPTGTCRCRGASAFLKGRNTCIVVVTYKTESNFKAAQSPHFALQKCDDTLIFTSLYLPHFLKGKVSRTELCQLMAAVTWPSAPERCCKLTKPWVLPHSALCITDNLSGDAEKAGSAWAAWMSPRH